MVLFEKLKSAFSSRKRFSLTDWRDITVISLTELTLVPWFVGTVVSLMNNLSTNVGRCWWLGFSNYGIRATLFFEVVATMGVIVIYYLRADSKTKDEVGRTVSDTGTFGDSHFQSEEEIKRYYTLSDQKSANRTILGALDANCRKIVSEHKTKKGEAPINRNLFILASAGSGKTKSVLYPLIMQLTNDEHPENLFITDPKGEIYEDFEFYLERKGYDVYTFITKSDVMQFSDRFNPLDFLDLNINKIRSLASYLYDFDPQEKPEYFQNGEINLFITLCAYFSNPELSHPKEANTLSYMYKYICNTDRTRIINELKSIPQGATGYEESRQFIANMDRFVDYTDGLKQTLQRFNSEDCAAMTSASDFEPLDFVGRKCAVFLITDDHDSTFDSLTRMFFNVFINRISEIADRLPNRMYPDFNMVLEETNNIGKIHTLDKIISTVRGRRMNTTLTFQNIKQMQGTYKEQYASLISACHTQMVFGVNDPETAQWVSNMLSQKTIQTDAISRSEGTFNMVDVPLHQSHRYDEKAADLMSPGNVMKNDKMIVRTFKKDPMLLYPLFYEKHYEFNLLEKHMLTERLPKRKRPVEYYDYYQLPRPDKEFREANKKEIRQKYLMRKDIDKAYADLLKVPIIEDSGLVIERPKPTINPEAVNLDRNRIEEKPKGKEKKPKEEKPERVIAVTTVQDENKNIVKQTVQEVTPKKVTAPLPKNKVIDGKELPLVDTDINEEDII